LFIIGEFIINLGNRKEKKYFKFCSSKLLVMKNIALVLVLMLIALTGYGRSAYEVVGNNVVINLDAYGIKSNLLKVELWSEHSVRIVSTMGEEFEEYSGIMANRSNEEVKFKVAYAQSDIEITTSHVFISISEKGLVRLFSRDGRKLMVESDRSFEPVDGNKEFYQVSQRFFMNRKEHIYGLGQKHNERLDNLRGQSFDIVQSESSLAMPVFYSEKGYAFIWDNYSKTHFTDEPSGLTLSSEYEKEISYFFINGPDWNTLFSEIQFISGYSNLLPYTAYNLPLKSKTTTLKTLENSSLTFNHNVFNNSLLKKEKYQYATDNKQFENIAAYLELKNDYGLIKSEADGQRPAITTHINTPGIQQYSTVTTAGELPGSWDALKSQVIAGITSSFSGQLHWSTNIGGASAPVNKNEASDLLTRWYQFAAFTPVMQVVPVTQNGYNIQAGSENFAAIENALKLRNMLLPYTYSTAAIAVRNKHAIMRSLLYDFREQDEVHELSTQYMFGPSMMVCPVTKPGNNLEITLPKGANWYNFYTGEKSDGGQKVNEETTIKNIPVFVKGGSVIPLIVPDTVNVYEVRVYPGADGKFVFYYDDKTSMDYENDLYTQIEFDYNDRRNQLTINSAEGDYPEFPETVTFRVVLVKDGKGIGNTLCDEYETVIYDGSKTKVKF
jgi:alpha-glucosidase (family GH31 glycosyl hydrolase)